MENFNALIANAQNSIANLRESITKWCRKNVNLMVEFECVRTGIWGEDSETMYCYYAPEDNDLVYLTKDGEFECEIWDAPIEDVIAIAQAIADNNVVAKEW